MTDGQKSWPTRLDTRADSSPAWSWRPSGLPLLDECCDKDQEWDSSYTPIGAISLCDRFNYFGLSNAG